MAAQTTSDLGDDLSCAAWWQRRGKLHYMDADPNKPRKTWRVWAEEEVEAEAERVWAVVRQFCQAHVWCASLDTCEKVEGEEGVPGCVRLCRGRNDFSSCRLQGQPAGHHMNETNIAAGASGRRREELEQQITAPAQEDEEPLMAAEDPEADNDMMIEYSRRPESAHQPSINAVAAASWIKAEAGVLSAAAASPEQHAEGPSPVLINWALEKLRLLDEQRMLLSYCGLDNNLGIRGLSASLQVIHGSSSSNSSHSSANNYNSSAIYNCCCRLQWKAELDPVPGTSERLFSQLLQDLFRHNVQKLRSIICSRPEDRP